MKPIIQFLNILFIGNNMPLFDYDNKEAMVKHGGGIVTLTGCHYSSELGSYVYWADAHGVKVVIPEAYLESL